MDVYVQNSIDSLLGFVSHAYTNDRSINGYVEGENYANLININSILVNSDINMHGTYVNGTQQSTINIFFPAVDPDMKIT